MMSELETFFFICSNKTILEPSEVNKYPRMHYYAAQNKGQGSRLQDWHSVNLPSHGNPPYCGSGLSHLLDLVWPPPPHDTEHCDQSSQSLKPPFTVNKNNIFGYV